MPRRNHVHGAGNRRDRYTKLMNIPGIVFEQHLYDDILVVVLLLLISLI